MLIQVALDGSWDTSNARVYAYGGVGAIGPSWRAFGGEWVPILNRYGLRSFHMAEAMSFHGQFKPLAERWGDEKESRRAALLDELIAVATKLEFVAFGSSATLTLMPDKSRVARKKTVSACCF